VKLIENDLFQNKPILRQVILSLTILTGLLAFGLGFYGYLLTPVYDWKHSIFYAMRLFLFEFDVKDLQNYPMQLEFARWLAVITILSSVSQALLYAFNEKAKLFSRRLFGKHVVIVGINKYTVELAKDLLLQKKKVILLSEEADHKDFNTIKAYGANVVVGNLIDPVNFKKSSLHKCSHFIIFTEDDSKNIEVMLQAQNYLELRERKDLKVKMHISNKQLEPLFERIEGGIKNKGYMDVQLFNVYENASKLLFESHPLYMNNEGREDHIHLLIIGFSEVSLQVILQAAKVAHYGLEKKLKVTVVDEDAERIGPLFHLQYPQFHQVCDLEFKNVNIHSSEFYKEFLIANPSISYVVVCQGTEQDGLTSSLNILNELKNVPIAFHIVEDNQLASWIDANDDDYKYIHRFGGLHEVMCSEVILSEGLDILAKEIHNHYSMKAVNKVDDWPQLNLFSRASNRAQADHIDTKLHLLGLVKEKKGKDSDGDVLSKEEFMEILIPHLERIAIAEHERWNAFHYIYGWTSSEPQHMKNEKAKTHPCLVSWNELDNISKIHSQLFNESINYKDYDRQTGENLYDVLGKAGYVIKKKQ